MYVIDLVKDCSGEWSGLYLNDNLKHDGHDIPDRIWLSVIADLAFHNEILVREWETDMLPNESLYPASMSDLLIFKDDYKLKPIDGADACILH